jgi:hypothetical protein
MWRVLVVHFTPRPRAVRLTTEQHLQALLELPDAEVLDYNAVHGLPSWLRHLHFDAVILHTTLLGMRWSPWFEQWKARLAWLGGLDAVKIALPQDEYWHAETLDTWLDELGVSVVGTVLDEAHRSELYPRLSGRADFHEVLTGYIDDSAAERMRARLIPAAQRPFDVVYRARKLPYWLGSHGQLKHRIGEAVLERADRHDLRCDVSTRLQETVLGDAWLDFLGSGRATVGAESGSSTLDRRGELQAEVEKLVTLEPDLTFDELDARMPPGWDDYRFFAVSPRHLEAVVTRTAQILVEGHYSGVLEPDRHYIPVKRDLSDLDDALEAGRDPVLLARITEQAYEDVYQSGRFSSRRLTDVVGQILRDHAGPGARGRSPLVPVAGRIAAAEGFVGRTVVGPVSNVLQVGRAGYREVLAGLRLATVDPHARRLLVDYLRSQETREHVSPREALTNLLCLGALRRAKAGRFTGSKPYEIAVLLDTETRKLVLQSREPASAGADGGPSPDQLEELLLEPGWEFAWDHSRVGDEIAYPLTRSRSVRLSLSTGPSPLPVLNWLARYRPQHVASALGPVLRRR